MDKSATTPDSVDLVRRFVESYNDRTLHDGAEDVFARDVVLVNEAAGLEAHGIDELLQHVLDGWLEAVPDAEVELADYEIKDDGIDFTMRSSGTFTGELATPDGTVPGTGESFELEFRVHADVVDGRVTRWESESDMADFQHQVGLA